MKFGWTHHTLGTILFLSIPLHRKAVTEKGMVAGFDLASENLMRVGEGRKHQSTSIQNLTRQRFLVCRWRKPRNQIICHKGQVIRCPAAASLGWEGQHFCGDDDKLFGALVLGSTFVGGGVSLGGVCTFGGRSLLMAGWHIPVGLAWSLLGSCLGDWVGGGNWPKQVRLTSGLPCQEMNKLTPTGCSA